MVDEPTAAGAPQELTDYLSEVTGENDKLLKVLAGAPEPARAGFNATCLRRAKELQNTVLAYLGGDRSAETIESQDAVILRYLKAMYLSLVSTDATRVEDNLEELLMNSGMLEPWVGPNGSVGVPKEITTDMKCDTVSELCRVVAAATVTYLIYISCPQEPGSMPPDHCCTMMVILALQSMRTKEQAEALNAGMEGLVGGDAPTCNELGWLMHFVQAAVHEGQSMAHREAKNYNSQRNAIEEQQKCCMMMIKCCNKVPRGYLHFANASLMGQQIRPAALFLKKGLELAKECGADLDAAHMGHMLATCMMMGGLSQTWTVGSLEEMKKEAEEQAKSAERWVPKKMEEIALQFEPWKSRTPEALMAQVELTHGRKIPKDKELSPVQGKVIMPGHTAQPPLGAFIRPQ